MNLRNIPLQDMPTSDECSSIARRHISAAFSTSKATQLIPGETVHTHFTANVHGFIQVSDKKKSPIAGGLYQNIDTFYSETTKVIGCV
jgi:hypothetical protein